VARLAVVAVRSVKLEGTLRSHRDAYRRASVKRRTDVTEPQNVRRNKPLPWSEVREINVRNGDLLIVGQGKRRSWATASIFNRQRSTVLKRYAKTLATSERRLTALTS
jgi:hypothetical protein